MSRNHIKGFLGIDVGSISINIVIVSQDGNLLYDSYERVNGSPIKAVQEALPAIDKVLGGGLEVCGAGVTGSARHLVGGVVGADVVKNEISAHARAAIHLHPEVNTIFEIGGQDSKVTVVRDGVVVDFAMNLVCAAGTGSFLDSQAKRLNITTEELSERAVLSRSPTSIAGRCTVFAESDMIHKQQVGHRQEDIIMGLCYAMVRNFLSNVCNGKEIKPPLVLQGGISANKGIKRAFESILGSEIIIPRYNMVMGAYGAALLAAESGVKNTSYRGEEICNHKIDTRSFTCRDCPNHCEIIEVMDNIEIISRSGGRCRKWEGVVNE